MSYYAIGIGGTGAKCLESLLQLSAAGLMPDEEDLNILFVDPDGANGSLGRAASLLNGYRDCRNGRVAGTDIFKTPVKPTFHQHSTDSNPVIWSPIENGKHQLDNFFNSNLLSLESSHLFNLLFSPEEQKMNLDVGFRGRPSIGAAVMASAIDLNNTEPWRTIKEKIKGDLGDAKPVKIMLFGSIFGGTGASGFPTIARIIKDWMANFPAASSNQVKLGGVLMLPYFSFAPVEKSGIAANSEDFLLNTQAALQYYSRQADLEVFDAVYILGSEDRLKMRESQIGGRLQENDPHFAELYAALAAVDFFDSGQASAASTGNRYKMIARAKSNSISWTDLPSTNNQLQQKLLQMTRFSFAYLSNYHPMLQKIAASQTGYKAPWYINFFEFKKIDLQNELEHRLKFLKEYCENFLLWLARVEFSIAGKQSNLSNLVNIASFSAIEEDARGVGTIKLRTSFDSKSFNEILLPNMKPGDSTLADIWERMCSASSKGNEANGTWYFINELYRQCGQAG